MRLSLLSLAVALCAFAQVDVLTSHYDTRRTSSNLHETVLNPSNVSADTFGKIFSLDLDGQVYAQTLIVANLAMSDSFPHDVVFAATMHNSIYAVDIATGSPLWHVNLGPAVPAANYGCHDIQNEVGILSTPVIDRDSQTIFAVANTVEDGVYHYRLHALDLATGEEKMGGPVEVTAPGFDPVQHWQRPALLLMQGIVYIGFGSHCDIAPFNGWIIGHSAAQGMAQASYVNLSANGSGASVWQSGRGLAADDAGVIYAATGNGDFDGALNFGECVMALSPNLSVSDWFVVDNWSDLNDGDRDLGSSGVALVPNTNFAITGTKDGRLFVLDRAKLGNFAMGNTQIVQQFHPIGFGIFTFAMWPRDSDTLVYIQGNNDVIKAYSLGRNGFDPNPVTQGLLSTGVPYQGMTISSNGSDPDSAILWVTSADDSMHAYAAANLQNELWNSSIIDERDTIGSFSKFVPPTVANGYVTIGTATNQLLIYGLLPQRSGPTPPDRTGPRPPRVPGKTPHRAAV